MNRAAPYSIFELQRSELACGYRFRVVEVGLLVLRLEPGRPVEIDLADAAIAKQPVECFGEAEAVLGELNLLLRRRTRRTALFLGPVRVGVMDKLLPLVVGAGFVEPELLKPQNGGLLADLEAASGPPNVVEVGVLDD